VDGVTFTVLGFSLRNFHGESGYGVAWCGVMDGKGAAEESIGCHLLCEEC